MKLIAGLGNPGDKYKLTRHNIGFIILDEFAKSMKVDFTDRNALWHGVETEVSGEKVYLMKPMTYMNKCGEAIGEFFDTYETDLQEILIISDDFNLPLGTIRVRPKGSDGGHNGLADITYFLQSEEFPRMRIGIGRGEITKDDYVDFVLNNFDEDEMKSISELMPVYIDCIKDFITGDILNVMNKYNRSHLKS